METTEFLDSEEITDFGPQGPNQTLNVMCILGYIGNGLWLLLLLIAFMLINTLANSAEFEDIRQQMNISNAEDFETFLTFSIGICLLFFVICIIGLIGAHKGKTWGFVLYAIFNGIWAILLILNLDAFNVILGLISVAFIVTIGLNYKK